MVVKKMSRIHFKSIINWKLIVDDFIIRTLQNGLYMA